MDSASYEYRNMLARGGAQLCPLECRLFVGKPFPPKTTKMLLTRNSSMLMMSSSVFLLFEATNQSKPNMVLATHMPSVPMVH